MNSKNQPRFGYRSLAFLAVGVGIFGIGAQFFPVPEWISYLFSIAALGGLLGRSKDYEEQYRQRLIRSYKTTIEWLLLSMMAAYPLIELFKWMSIDERSLLPNSHWPGFVLALMCLLMGIPGVRKVSA